MSKTTLDGYGRTR